MWLLQTIWQKIKDVRAKFVRARAESAIMTYRKFMKIFRERPNAYRVINGFTGKINIFNALVLSFAMSGCNTVRPIMQIEGTNIETLSLNRDATFFDHKKSRTRDDIFLCSYEFQGQIEKIVIADMDITKISGGASLSWGSRHILYQKPLIELSARGYLCDDHYSLKKLTALLRSWKKQKSFLESIAVADGGCWKGSNPNANCAHHKTEEVALIFNAMTHAWLLNRQYFESLRDHKELRDYIALGNSKIVRYQASRTGYFENYPSGGIYAQMLQSNGMLLHALLIDDPRVFDKWKKDGLRKFNHWVEKDGLIYNNSYRGTRSVHYHGIGVDSLAQFKRLIEYQGDSLKNYGLEDRYWKSIDQAMLAFSQPKRFEGKGFKGKNHLKDEFSAIRDFRADNRAWLFLERAYITNSGIGDQELFSSAINSGAEMFNPGQMTGWAHNNILSAISDDSSRIR